MFCWEIYSEVNKHIQVATNTTNSELCTFEQVCVRPEQNVQKKLSAVVYTFNSRKLVAETDRYLLFEAILAYVDSSKTATAT